MVRYLAQDDPITAERFGLSSDTGISREHARKRTSIEYQAGLGSLPFGPYRIHYRALAERKRLELLKILHGMRELRPNH